MNPFLHHSRPIPDITHTVVGVAEEVEAATSHAGEEDHPEPA